MTTAFRISLLLAAVVVTPLCAQSPNPKPQSPSLQELERGFLNPPDSAKPIVRWWWFGPAVVKPEILRELEQMKADGIGGAELAFVYPEVLDDPAKGLKNLPFLSPAMLDDVRYAQEQGRRLGLRIDVTLCSGWPYGGPNTPLSQAAGRLKTIEVAVPAGATSADVPKLGEGESLLSAAIVEGHLSEQGGPQGHLIASQPVGWDAKSAQPLTISGDSIAVNASQKPRVALFFVAGHTKQQVKRAAVGAKGYVLDPFSQQAVATHLEKVGAPLLSAFGSTPPYAIFSDSLEAYGADWTPRLPAEFEKRRGYDLIPHLPELVAGGSPEAEKVRHDWGVTLTELVNENYLTQINEWAKAHGTKFRSQTYGEPAVDFSSENLVALAEGEGPQWRAFSTLRWATSANHVFGHAVTSGETFTWLHSPVFRATPLDMKAEADIDFITGENQLVFHGWPYSPPDHEVPEPGWSLYASAVFNNHNPWHPVMPAVTAYLTRMSWVLRQGEPANQVAILLPTDDAWASFTPSHVSVTAAMQKLISPELMSAILSAGYNIDYIDADAIDRVGLGDHQILVIPPTERIPVETLKRLHPWYKTEGQVICFKRCPSLDPEGKPLPGMTGSFVVADDSASLAKDLNEAAKPDLSLMNTEDVTRSVVGFIRRKLPDTDLYYVVNTSNRVVTMDATFATRFSAGSKWSPETGHAIAEASAKDEKVRLAPYESALYVFSDAANRHVPVTEEARPLADITDNWRVDFTSLKKTSEEHTLTDWTADAATLHYSGEVDYTRDVTLTKLPRGSVYLTVDGGVALPGAPNSLPEPGAHTAALGRDGLPDPLITRPGPGMHAYFDPPIREAALVVINGQPAGALWHPPYRLDVTKLLTQGVNHIEIRVFNTALNAWSALPPHDYKPLIAKYGDRFQMQDLQKVKPISSGILGSIHLVSMEPGQ